MSKSSKKPVSQNPIVRFIYRQDWEDFLMKFLSVFLGIIITFAGNAWFTHRKEQREVKEALCLVHDELQNNVAIMDTMKTIIKIEDEAAVFLLKYQGHYKDCPQDSLLLYCNAPLSIFPIKSSHEALELLKTSSLFSKISDKMLALDIIRAYTLIKMQEENYDFYNDKKKKLLEASIQQRAKSLLATGDFTAAEMWDAFTSTDEGLQFLNEIHRTLYDGMNFKKYSDEYTRIISRLEEFISN